MPPDDSRRGVLVDTGPLVAILNADDQYHARCVDAAKSLRGPFLTVWPVITEATYLLRHRPRAVDRLLSRLSDDKLRLVELTAHDVDAIRAIAGRYADQGLDLADAALMHVAERERIHTVFTIDLRHFTLFRTSTGGRLDIIPDTIEG